MADTISSISNTYMLVLLFASVTDIPNGRRVARKQETNTECRRAATAYTFPFARMRACDSFSGWLSYLLQHQAEPVHAASSRNAVVLKTATISHKSPRLVA